MSELASHWLVVVVALPALAGVGLVVAGFVVSLLGLPPPPSAVWRATGLGVALVDLAIAVGALVGGFDPERSELQLVDALGGAGTIGAQGLLGLDGISLCFLVSTTALVPLAMIASGGEVRSSVRSWVLGCLLLETSLLGAIASANLLAFAFFWALGLAPMLLWLGRWGGVGRARAASRLWITESAALAGLLFVAFVLREHGIAQLGFASLDLVRADAAEPGSLLDVAIAVEEQRLLFGVMVAALACRLPLVPLHFWLPAAQATAPTGLSVLVATGFTQTAAVGLLRFALPLFPDAAQEAGPLLSLLGIAALVYASLLALVQKELKRLIAYASIGYAGFSLFGIATLTVQGMTGAVVQLLTHGLATAGLFVLVGALAARRETTEVAAFGGLAKPMPVCAFFFGVMVLSLMGLPLLGGFVGDLFVLLGSLETRRELSLAALLAMVVAASYLLWVQRRIFLGPVEEPANRGLIDLDRRERALLLALSIPLVWIGIYPNPVLRRIEPAVLEILYQMDRRIDRFEIPDPGDESEVVSGAPGAETSGRAGRALWIAIGRGAESVASRGSAGSSSGAASRASARASVWTEGPR